MVLDTHPLVIKTFLPHLSNQGMIRDLLKGKFQERLRKLTLILGILDDHQTPCMYPMNRILRKKKLLNKSSISLMTQVEFLSMHYFISTKTVIVIASDHLSMFS